MLRTNSGHVGASTVAGTDYLCGNSGENEEDGVNIGSNDDNDEFHQK